MSLLQMSVSGAVLIAVIAAVRALTIHRLPKRVFVLLWGVVLLRLLVPLSIPARMSVYSFVPKRTLAGAENILSAAGTAPAPAAGDDAAGAPEASGKKTASDEGTKEPFRNLFPPFPVHTFVWLAGVLAFAMFFLVCYVRCRREFAMSLPVRNAFAAHWLEEHRRWRYIALRQSDRIAAPLTYGIFRPVILMPKRTDWADEEQVSCVLLHEYIHICRFDALWKLVAAAALCLHWFNPMVWVLYFLLNRDIELSCDECVVRRLGGDARAVYARTLIAMEEKKSGLLPLYSNFSRNAIEERIKEIMRAKKITVGITIASVALVAVIAGVFATSAKADEQTDAALQAADGREEQEGARTEDFGEEEEPEETAGDDSGEADGQKDAMTDDAGGANGQRDAGTGDAGGANGTDGSGNPAKPEEHAAAIGSDHTEGPVKKLVYVKALADGTITFDEIEWVVFPSARANELGFTEDDAPNGFVTYNETVRMEELSVAADCACEILDWEAGYVSKEVSLEDLERVVTERVEYLDEVTDQEGWMLTPYHLTVENGQVVDIHEQYVP